ncbi:hypothetical protein PVAND_001442 [Polypedilum vanderplanki]|uniref:Mpv17-like protein n=1 Tax=Polypedilum vanderplanki TaxID=319348 RepID=A0A9J6BMY9_POLVA|nr:hypothetical protein PVAND_001442 [Polypedilum vanderplanki]
MGALIEVKVDKQKANYLLNTALKFLRKHRIVRGMLSYSILWPVGCMLQQTFEGKSISEYDWKRILRFCIYGTFIQGPALYCWIRVANKMWPRSDIRSLIAKAFTEQFAFDPFSITSFLYIMSVLEGRTHEQAKDEVKKYFCSFIRLLFWPIAQTINFSLIKPKNQVIYASFASLIWTTFLAYIKSHPIDEEVKRRMKARIKKRYDNLKERYEHLKKHE